MLPDFPKVSRGHERQVLRLVHDMIPQIAPLLGMVGRFRQHEGKHWRLDRADGSEQRSSYIEMQVKLELDRKSLMTPDIQGLVKAMHQLAERFAEQQSKMVLQGVSAAAEEVGNHVDAGGDFRPEHLLDMLDRKETDFDPVTGQPVGEAFVMHPDTAAKVIPKIQEWQRDPEFRRRVEEIETRKRMEWREREGRRKLVD